MWWVCSETGRILTEVPLRDEAESVVNTHPEASWAVETETNERIERDLRIPREAS